MKHYSQMWKMLQEGYIDLIINPADTRKYLIAGFEMLFTKKVEGAMEKHGSNEIER